MGLFDEIEMSGAWLNLPASVVVFQTKTFDCMMERYQISDDGKLQIQEYEIEDQGDKSAPDGSFERIFGCMTHVPTGLWRDVNWHGFVDFGNETSDYRAKFTDGKLVHVEAVGLTKPASVERRKGER